MTVAHILKTKGQQVHRIRPDATLGDAARKLAELKIGVLVVGDGDGPIAGIISERDIVRAIGLHGPAILDLAVSRHMTEQVITCVEADHAMTVMEIMTSGRFRHMPVLNNGRVVGLVSIGDVVKRRLGELETEKQAMQDYISQG
jgi:CBS domain-containing protein